MKNDQTPSARTNGFVTTLPFRSQQIDDPDANYDVSVWRSAENLCEFEAPDAPCDTVSGLYYGSAEDEVTKFCPRHFYAMHHGPNAPYRLVDCPASPVTDRPRCLRCRRPTKTGGAANTAVCPVCLLADEAEDALGEILVKHFPGATTGDASPGSVFRLRTALEAAIEEWMSNNVPEHQHGNAA